jgi:outer membrane protein assembly factor BamB
VRKAVLGCVVAAGVAAAAAAVYVVVHETRRPPDVRGSTGVEFVPKDIPAPRKHPPARSVQAASIDWPTYGYDARRLRAAPGVLLPPFRRVWTFHGRALLEFPPALAYGRLYLPTFDGRFYALDRKTGKATWRFDSGRCSWASPAVSRGVVFETFLNRSRNCDRQVGALEGELIAFDARNGHVRWLRRLPPTESSPLVHGGLVYVGDWSGRVSAYDERNGKLRWRFQTDGAVKGSAALADNRLFIGSYDGHVYALDAATGKQIWRASAQSRLGHRGTFYSTPAVAYGRVYIGSTDRKVYSFGQATGELRWARSTGGYVYSSPAIWHRLVLIGSYDGSFYALDAATGDVRWRFAANGPISGSPTVLAGVVYFATLRERTYALDARSGKLVWSFPDGKYSPVVADDRRLYLVGYGRLYGMVSSRTHRAGSADASKSLTSPT